MEREGLAISSSQIPSDKPTSSAQSSERPKPVGGPTVFRGREQVEPIHRSTAVEPPAVQNRPSLFPHDGDIAVWYSRIIQLRNTANSRSELEDGLDGILMEMAQSPGSYTSKVVNLLMKHWLAAKEEGVSPYTEHMKDHVEAVTTLIKAWTKDRYLNLPKVRIFDASCGDGKVIEAFLDSLPKEVLKRVEVVANDVSSASLDSARENLKRFQGKVRIEFTRFDITQELPNRQFDVVLLSQTLPFIVSEGTLRAKRLQMTMHKDEDGHITAKAVLLKAMMKRLLRPETGELLLIDEHPMKFTKSRDESADRVIENRLFEEVFREIDEETVVKKMKQIPHAKFLGHLKAPIDRVHEMYLMAYSKIPKKSQAESAVRDGHDDELRIIHAVEKVHPILIARREQFDGNGSTFYRPIDSGSRLIIDPKYYAEKIEGNPFYWKKNGSNNIVIIKDMIHDLGIQEYARLIEHLRTSKKAETGASLLFIDEYPKRDGGKREPARINSKARDFMNDIVDHQFVASFHEGTRYGYLYVIRPKVSHSVNDAPSSQRGGEAANTDPE